jgi:hypothetical protein
VRERLLNRLWFTASLLIALGITTAVIVALAPRPAPARLLVRPAATPPPARPAR